MNGSRVRTRASDATILLSLVVGLITLSLMTQRVSYEVWAGILLIPVLALFSFLVLRSVTRARFAHLLPILVVGMVAKFVASGLRFYVFASAYSGNGDAGLYFDRGSELASAVRDGRKSITTVLPWETSLQFMYRITGLVLTVVGPTQFGAFLVFATLGYWGTVLLVLAACRAVPGLQERRYAWFCALAPSLLFWPSSIGKEAVVIFGIGLLSTGVSRLLTADRRRLGAAQAILGGAVVASIRAHLAAIFLAGVVVALLQLAFVPAESGGRIRRSWATVLAIGAASLLALVSWVAVRRLGVDDPNAGFLSDVSAALDKASVVSDDGGTSFEPINTDNPLLWPVAVVRTLTRPLPTDIDGARTLLPTLETSLLIVLGLAAARRIRHFVTLARRAPYLTYSAVSALLFGLAFSAIANLGALIRQRSLVWAFLILLLCLPELAARPDPPSTRRSGAVRRQRSETGAAASRAW